MQQKIDQVITPKIGVGIVILGSTREEITELLGEPSETRQVRRSDGIMHLTWEYRGDALALNFDEDDDYRLCSITTKSKSAFLESSCPIGLTEGKLIEQYPKVKLTDDVGEFGKEYTYEESEIIFWVKDGIVSNLTIFPEYDETGNIPIWPK